MMYLTRQEEPLDRFLSSLLGVEIEIFQIHACFRDGQAGEIRIRCSSQSVRLESELYLGRQTH